MASIIPNLRSKNMKISDLIAEIQGKNPNFHSFNSSTVDGMKKAPSIEHMDVMAQANKAKQDRLLEAHDKEVQKTNEYNNKILQLDPLYAEIEPYDASKVVIRMFLKDPMTIGGVAVFGVDKVSIRTHNGQGELKKVDNPFRFKRLGIVVAASDRNMTLKQGDIVATDYIMSVAPIPGDESIIEYQYAFTHYSYQEMGLPKDPMNQHFGYILVPSTFVTYKEGNIFEDGKLTEEQITEKNTTVTAVKEEEPKDHQPASSLIVPEVIQHKVPVREILEMPSVPDGTENEQIIEA